MLAWEALNILPHNIFQRVDHLTMPKFAIIGLQHNDQAPKTIVKIDVEKLHNVTLIDLSNEKNCSAVWLNPEDPRNERRIRAYNFALSRAEVFVAGRIPAEAIVRIFNNNSPDSELECFQYIGDIETLKGTNKYRRWRKQTLAW